ncbi:MAG: BMP family ABC transporter substrate-binding protein [Oligoflexia bacterium]|nr:BMP family ABC transporter substrate-binding protein [Oligoflexia bacterium]
MTRINQLKAAGRVLGLFALVLALLGALAGKCVYASEFKVGMVLDKGGKEDKSFNNAAYDGFKHAKAELKITGKVIEASDDNSYEPLLRAMASRDFDLIIAIGFAQAEAVKRVSKAYPSKHFVIVDAEVEAPNVRTLMFREHEGSFLVGALAALVSHTGKIGFIGGMDGPLIRRFEMGYIAGAKYINPRVKVISNFVGVSVDAWNNPAKGKELAIAQYSEGGDIIFGAAGASGNGVFDAAEEEGRLVIGVDSNQNWVKPGHVLTSMLKRVDVAVFDTIRAAQSGQFAGGIFYYGLANSGIDYAMDQYNEALVPKAARARIEELKKAIIDGKIRVPDYYEKK